MAKLKLSSWLNSNSSSNSDGEAKKQNRRSFSALSASLLGKDAQTNGSASSPSSSSPSKQANGTAAGPQSTSRMVELAQKIAKETEKLEAYMKKNNLPMPSFDADAPTDFPKLPEDISQSRMEVICATKELGLLAQGPRESVRWGIWEFLDVLALQAINHYGIGEYQKAFFKARIPLSSILVETNPHNV